MGTASLPELPERHRSREGEIVISGGVEALKEGLQAVGVCAEVTQCSADRQRTSIAVHRLESIRLLHITWGCTTQVSAKFGADTVAVSAPLLLPKSAGAKTVWTGTTISAEHVGAVPPAQDSESTTPAGSEALVGLVDASAIAGTADALGWQVQLPKDAGPLPSHLGLRDGLVALHHSLGLARDRYPHRGDTRRAVGRLLEGLAFLGRPDSIARPRPRRRFVVSERIVSVAIELAQAGFGSAPSMAEICATTGLSERRVRDAFMETKGMSPQKYFQLRSLNLARARLRASSPGETSVTDIAFSLGIFHLGRFAYRYRALFGEAPHQTLKRPAERTETGSIAESG